MTSFAEVVTADVVVVGSGVSGLTTALSMPGRDVVVVTKGPLASGSTRWAQGGIAAAVGPDDDAVLHAADTVAVGAGLNDAEAVRALTSDGAAAVARLVERGAAFDRDDRGELILGREAGHSVRRILHADGDATGAEVSRALTEAVERSPVRVLEHARVTDLHLDGGRIAGLTAVVDGRPVLVAAPVVVLATGGLGHVYAKTTNPPEVSGDGLDLASRAGADLADLEFVQFHPTALDSGRDPMGLLTEALRGEGAVLLDDRGTRYMVGEHPDAELAPRDVVARATWRLLREGRRPVLDATTAVGAAFPDRFPTVFALCAEAGLDPRREPVPVSPAAHYHMGGIVTDLDGRSTVPGLWAVGEVTRTGVHGANRLASNSLLEGLVFGGRAAVSILDADPAPVTAPRPDPPPAGSDPQPDLEQALRDVMWAEVGVVRTGTGLADALDEIERIEEKAAPGRTRLRSMLTVARAVTEAAARRTESRGGHFRADHPETDPAWARSVPA
ncbi:MAG: L-aspartate oxidase [Acidimicrobiia bacterium]|nr:L-aspartate oxidase [Acidimicrobiia bacterium]